MSEHRDTPSPAAEKPAQAESASQPAAGEYPRRVRTSPAVISDRPSEPATYQPMSALAIAGFLMAAIYALIIVFLGGAALYHRSPLLLGLWSLLPLLSGALCLAAWGQIKRSEGTRAGLVLARWGLWSSLVFGLGYGAFYAATYFAVRAQSDDFTQDRFFNALKAGKVNAAFLATQDPSIRRSVNPEDPQAMAIRFDQPAEGPMSRPPLTGFRESELVRSILQAGTETEVTPLGVAEWEYRTGGYRLRRSYRVKTLEGEFTALLTTQSMASRSGDFEEREWAVMWHESGVSKSELSALGKERLAQRATVQAFLIAWGEKVTRGNLEEAYLDTLDPAERPALREIYLRRLLASGLGFGTQLHTLPILLLVLDGDLARDLYMPGYADFASKLLKLDENRLRSADDATLKVVRGGLETIFRPSRANYRFLGLSLNDRGGHPWAIDNGRVQFTHNAQLGFDAAHYADIAAIAEHDPKLADARMGPAWRLVRIEVRGAGDRNRESRGPREGP